MTRAEDSAARRSYEGSVNVTGVKGVAINGFREVTIGGLTSSMGHIKIKDRSVKTSVTLDSYVDVKPDKVELYTKDCTVTAKKNVEITAQKVLLG